MKKNNKSLQKKKKKNHFYFLLVGKSYSKEAKKGIFVFQSSSCVCIKHLHLPAATPDSALTPPLEEGG